MKATVVLILRRTVENLTEWPVTAYRAVAGLPGRLGRLARRRTVVAPPTPYTRCAGCGKGGRDDQQVPDPDQFTKPKAVPVVTGAATAEVHDEVCGGDLKLIDAAPVWCGDCRAWFHAVQCYSLHRLASPRRTD